MAGIETMPITRPMFLGPATWAMIIIARGMIMPPPTPCRIRKKISSPIEPERPQSAEPPVNSTREIRYIRRAPNRLAAHPDARITAPRASRYPPMIHCDAA